MSRPVCPRCGKRVWTSHARAAAAAIRDEIRHHVYVQVYECPHGNGFHVSSHPTVRGWRRSA